jgi:hypothetical protein
VSRLRTIPRLAGEPIRHTDAERDRTRLGDQLCERLHRLTRDEAGMRELLVLIERAETATAPIGESEFEREVLNDLVAFLKGEEA